MALAVTAAGLGGFAGAALSSHAVTLDASTAATTTSPSPFPSGHGRGHGEFLPGLPKHGGLGTVTGIDTSARTITLRTLLGTLTVTTTSSTKYEKERHSVSFSDIHIGDVLLVRGTPSGGSSTTPPTSIAADRITIQVPAAMGRVQSVSGDVITVVTRDGGLGYITTTGSTKYEKGDGSSASSSDVKSGVFIAAQGSRQDMTHLTADVITVLPAPGSNHGNGRPAFAGGPPPFAGGPSGTTEDFGPSDL